LFDGDFADGIHVACVAAVVKDDDRLRLRPERSSQVVGVEVQVFVAPHVAEDRRGAGIGDRVRRCDEVERGQHDLVTGPATDREQREVDRRRPIGDRERVLDPEEVRVRAFELGDARPHAPPARVERLRDRVPELRVDADVGKRYGPTCRLVAAQRAGVMDL
jgi:hypothetical protein